MCNHEIFESVVSVTRLTDHENSVVVNGFCADIKIRCRQCEQDFEFVGVSGGSSPFEPRVSIDSTELRIPINPSTGQLIFEPNSKLN